MSRSIQTWINRESGYITRWMKVWDKKFFHDFLSSLVIQKTTIMGKLWLNPHKNSEKNSERNRHFLEKESFADFPARIERRCFALVGEITDSDFICMDEVYVAKPCARTMEWLSRVRDGSTGAIVNGYLFHGASIRGIPVVLEREDLGKDTKWLIFNRIMDRILSYSKKQGTFLLDAGYDIASYLDSLTNKWCTFIIRAKKNRILWDPITNTYRKMKDFPVGIHRVQLPKKKKEDRYDLFLHVTKHEKFTEPMRVITNIADPHASSTYFRRWEIERIFKTMKQEFEMEKIRTQSLAILDNTIATIQLAVALSNACFNSDTKLDDLRWTRLFRVGKEFTKKFEKFTRRLGLTMNRNSIITFISHCLEQLYKRPKKDPRKHINRNPLDSVQQRLFTVG